MSTAATTTRFAPTPASLTVATWNVNSIRARAERLWDWVRAHQPTVLLLQETKVEDDQFPRLEYESLGYRVAHAGQKAYNGVAILSLLPLEDVAQVSMVEGDPQARFISATVRPDGLPGLPVLKVASAYIPNGQAVGTDKFAYKLNWLAGLRKYLDRELAKNDAVLIGGDFNVAPEPIDVYDPPAWENETLYHRAAREAFAHVCAAGLVDLFRRHHGEAGLYSWWDYRAGHFHRNRGLRIDHLLGTPRVAARCREAAIDREARKGKNASDHAPVIARLSAV